MFSKPINCYSQWVAQKPGTDEWLRSVKAFSDSIIIAVGDGNTIALSSDGGNSWGITNAGMGYFLTSVIATKDSIFFISGEVGPHPYEKGAVLTSSNLGRAWQYIYFDSVFGFNGITFQNSSVGWVIGNHFPLSVVKKTTDGGYTWLEQLRTDSLWFNSIFFGDSLHGWVTGSYIPNLDSQYFPSLIFRTTDGGDTWKNISPHREVPIRSAFFINSSTGWICGDSGLIMKTTDSGETWEEQIKSRYHDFYNIHFITPLKGWAVGSKLSEFREGGAVMTTTNGGVNWSLDYVPNSGFLFSVDFVDSLHGWAVGVDDAGTFLDSAVILKTTNGGVTFVHEQNHPLPQTISLHAYPNPFNPAGTITYELSSAGFINLSIYNLLGETIGTLVNQWSPVGSYSVSWDGTNYPGGIYFVRLKKGESIVTAKLLLVK